MANIVPDSFKTGLFKGTFNFDTSGNGGNAFKLALYTSISSYSTSSTVYLAGQVMVKLVLRELLIQPVEML